MKCPNPQCNYVENSSRAIGVHVGNTEACRKWRAEHVADSTGDIGPEVHSSSSRNRIVNIPWSKNAIGCTPSPPHSPGPVQAELEHGTDHGSIHESTPGTPSSDSSSQKRGPRIIKEHPRAAYDYGKGDTVLDAIDNDQFAEQRRTNIYHPFKSKEDFEFGSWLIRSGVSMAEIDKFLKLSHVSSFFSLSY